MNKLVFYHLAVGNAWPPIAPPVPVLRGEDVAARGRILVPCGVQRQETKRLSGPRVILCLRCPRALRLSPPPPRAYLFFLHPLPLLPFFSLHFPQVSFARPPSLRALAAPQAPSSASRIGQHLRRSAARRRKGAGVPWRDKKQGRHDIWRGHSLIMLVQRPCFQEACMHGIHHR